VILSVLVEDVLDDSEEWEEDSTTGIYPMKMKLNCNIQQLLPVIWRRIKNYYPNINEPCFACFGYHNWRDGKEGKVK
jgi:hypothetical protein